MGFWKKFGGSVINAGSSLIGSIAGAIGQNRVVNKQIEAQKRENQLNREYNLMLARQQNQWNLEQWQRENDYNSPTSQMARLRQAGLNPDLMYGQGTTGNSVGSPEMTSGAPSEPTDMSAMLSKRSFGQTMQQILDKEQQRRMNEAQIEAIKANTNKTNSETQGQDINNAIQQIRLGNEVTFQNMKIREMEDAHKLSDAELQYRFQQIEESKKLCDQIDSNIAKNQALIADLDNQQQERLRESLRRDKQLQGYLSNIYAQNQELFARAQLTREQYDDMVISQSLRWSGIAAENDLKRSQKDLNDANVELAKQSYKTGEIEYAKLYYREGHYLDPGVLTFIYNGIDFSTQQIGRLASGTFVIGGKKAGNTYNHTTINKMPSSNSK